MNLLSFFKKRPANIQKVAKKQLKKNEAVLESLRAYDEGKKDISTSKLERRLPDIRVTP